MQGAVTGYGHIIYVIQQQDLNLYAFFLVIPWHLYFKCIILEPSVCSIIIAG